MSEGAKPRRPQLTQQLLHDLGSLVLLGQAQVDSDPMHQRRLARAVDRVRDFVYRHRAWKQRPR